MWLKWIHQLTCLASLPTLPKMPLTSAAHYLLVSFEMELFMTKRLLKLTAIMGCVTAMPLAYADTPSVLDQYLALYETESANVLPLTEDVTFDGSLLPEPIMGRDAVVSFLNRVVPSLGIKSVEIQQRFETADGACVEILFDYETLGQLEYAHCLEIEDGQISAIRLYFDPRPFLRE